MDTNRKRDFEKCFNKKYIDYECEKCSKPLYFSHLSLTKKSRYCKICEENRKKKRIAKEDIKKDGKNSDDNEEEEEEEDNEDDEEEEVLSNEQKYEDYSRSDKAIEFCTSSIMDREKLLSVYSQISHDV
jgi:hypothetical protein